MMCIIPLIRCTLIGSYNPAWFTPLASGCYYDDLAYSFIPPRPLCSTQRKYACIEPFSSPLTPHTRLNVSHCIGQERFYCGNKITLNRTDKDHHPILRATQNTHPDLSVTFLLYFCVFDKLLI